MNEFEDMVIYITTAMGPNGTILYSMEHPATTDVVQSIKNGREFREQLKTAGLIEGKDFF